MRIIDTHLKTISDSRGKPTLEATLTTPHGVFTASVPAGKSTGAHEAAVVTVETAHEKLAEIKDRLLVKDFETLAEFDGFLRELDGTENKSNLGANLILALSMCWARAKAGEEGKELHEYLRGVIASLPAQTGEARQSQIPFPIFNVINGGAHSPIKSLDFQEFQVIPTTRDFPLAFSVGAEYYRKLKMALEKKFGAQQVALGDEAGFSCPFRTNEEALEIMSELIVSQRYPLKIGLDIAATQMHRNGMYEVDGNTIPVGELMQKYEELAHAFPIVSIEDPFYEEDFDSFAKFTMNVSDTPLETRGESGVMNHNSPSPSYLKRGENHDFLVITDDLTTTNPARLQKAIDEKAGNSILIKPNQIGSISETLEVISLAYANGWQIVVSHRSGETMDDFIADLAVAAGAWGIKAGAPGKPERLAKYQRILDIVQGK
jgi:enolase